jgi:hypothetical protein
MFGNISFVTCFSSFCDGFDYCFFGRSVVFICFLSIISCFLCFLVSFITFIGSRFGIIFSLLNFFRTSILVISNNLCFHCFVMSHNFSFCCFMNFLSSVDRFLMSSNFSGIGFFQSLLFDFFSINFFSISLFSFMFFFFSSGLCFIGILF